MSRQSLISFFNRRWIKTASVILLLLVLVFFQLQTYNKAYRDIGYDFTSYLLSAQAILDGENPFETGSSFPYIYPMFFGFILIPLSLLPYWLSNFLWFWINVVSLLIAVIVLIKLSSGGLKTNWGAQLYGPLVIALLLLTAIIQNHLLNGQVNFVVLLFGVLFLKYYIENKTWPASVFLALASAIKLVPLILLLFLLLRRRYKTMLLSTVLFVSFCLLPVIYLGANVFDMYGDYIRGFIFDRFSSGELDHHKYFTLHGFLSQTVPALQSLPIMRFASAFIVAFSLAAVDMLAMRRNGRAADMWVFHLYLMAILFISPFSETHHLAFLLPAFVLMFLKLLHARDRAARFDYALLSAFIISFYIARAVAGPFFFISILLLFVAVARFTLKRTASNSVNVVCTDG